MAEEGKPLETGSKPTGIGGGVPVYTLVRTGSTLRITLKGDPPQGGQRVKISARNGDRNVTAGARVSDHGGSAADSRGVSFDEHGEIGEWVDVEHR